MFSKPKMTDSKSSPAAATREPAAKPAEKPAETGSAFPPKPKAPPSLISADLTVKGNIITSGDVQVEGTIDGDVRAHLLTVGESAVIKGEVVADDVVVNGKVIGRLRGLKVRLTSSAHVEGDIIHKTIAIESGAFFEGTVQRQEDPLGDAARPQGAAGGRGSAKSGRSSEAPAISARRGRTIWPLPVCRQRSRFSCDRASGPVTIP